MQFPPSLRRLGLGSPSPQSVHETHPLTWTFDIQFMTANVLALDTAVSQKEVGRRVGVRTQRLDAQWHAQAFHIIGVQEARTSKGTFHSEHYKIWSSGGEGPGAGCLGCELWCHRTLPLASNSDKVPLTLADFNVIVQHADARRLFVRFENGSMTFAVVVLHAPCLHSSRDGEPRPIEKVQAWWDDTNQLCVQLLQDDLAWFLADANAPPAAGETSCFGCHAAEPSNPQGEIFETFLLGRRLIVPSTFGHLHQGQSTTWTHPLGHKLRRDYILTSSAAALFQAHLGIG